MVLGLTRKINASIATIASKLAHSDFDPAFYRSYYSDLRHLRADEDLYAHFYWHGRKENRYKNAQDALNKLQLRFGNLPPDFNVHMYAALNRDLAGSYNNDLSLIAHFLQYGRIEGRPYTSDSISLFPWTDLFDTAAFVAYSYGWLKEVPKSKREAVEIFANEGIPRLAPLNLDLIFDPVYYRSIYEIPDDKSDEDMYADWLQQGLLEGKHPNEEDALKRLTSTWTYPASFDWEKYKSQLRSSEAIKLRDRVSVLRHLFEHGFEEGLAATTVGSGASELFRAIGDYHLVRKNFVVAHAAFDQAIQAGDDDHGHTFHRRGDTLMALERPSEALSDFKRAAESPYASVWSHINAASAAIKCGDFAEASTILRAARPRWEKHIRHREFVTSFINDVFADGTRAARELYKADDRGAADAKMREMLQECEKLILDLESLPVKAAIPSAGHISILANLDLAQCKYYRVDQKIRQLEAAGFEVKHFSHSDPGAFISSLVGAKAAIFYRVHAFPDIIRSILTANALGLPTYYDVDDLIFDSEHFPDTLESYEGQITRDDYNGLMYGVPLIRYAMSLCQFGIASTTPLAGHISKVVRSGQCHVMRNGFDERNDRSLLVGASPRPDRGVVSIFYGSGTKAHNSDFNELASSALASVLEKYRHVRLVIVGHLRLRPELERYKSQITRVEFIKDVDQYWSLLSCCDINLAVLFPNEMTDCKSEIKWLEAAMFQIPSVVCATATYREVLDNGIDAIIAKNPNEWLTALESLVNDRQLRLSVGAAARKKAIQNYSLEAAALFWKQTFGDPRERTAILERGAKPGEKRAEESKRKYKILMCNVFFAPQTFGGATRVFEDNINYLKNSSDEFDVHVFCSDEGASPPGRLRFDQYKGTPVYRLSTPRMENMDWSPFNEDNKRVFEKVIEYVQPDLIHFHCIQRLSASIVEVAKEKEVPYVITMHDGWWVSDHQFLIDGDGFLRLPTRDFVSASPPRGIDLAESITRRQKLSQLVDSAVAVTSVSNSFTRILKDAGVDNAISIPNGVSSLAPRTRASRSDERLVIGHVGGRSTHKGATLIEALLRATPFKNLKLIMVDYRFEPGTRVNRLWGTTPVTLCGPFPQSEVAELYASLDVLLCPSIWPEAFGLVAREAQALGLWVVTSNIGAMGEDIKDGENGFVVDVSDGRGLAKTLSTLDRGYKRYKFPPRRQKNGGMRQSDDQSREIANLYKKLIRNENV